MQVGVHRDDDIAFCCTEAAVEGWAFAVVATEFYAVNRIGILFLETFYHVPRIVGTAVADEDDLVAEAVIYHYSLDPAKELGQRLVFVVERNNNAYIHLIHVLFECLLFTIYLSRPFAVEVLEREELQTGIRAEPKGHCRVPVAS